jgi:hypothetical protein
MKALSIALLSLAMLSGCTKQAEETIHPAPTPEALQVAIDNAIDTLNEKTGSKISNLIIDWVEVPNDCRPHLDYFAQQLLWARIYQDSVDVTGSLYIDCSIAQQYKLEAEKRPVNIESVDDTIATNTKKPDS